MVSYLSHYTKLNSKLVKDVNIKSNMLKLIEEKRGKAESLEHILTGNGFLKKIPVLQALGLRLNKWDLMKLNSFCRAKSTVKQTK